MFEPSQAVLERPRGLWKRPRASQSVPGAPRSVQKRPRGLQERPRAPSRTLCVSIQLLLAPFRTLLSSIKRLRAASRTSFLSTKRLLASPSGFRRSLRRLWETFDRLGQRLPGTFGFLLASPNNGLPDLWDVSRKALGLPFQCINCKKKTLGSLTGSSSCQYENTIPPTTGQHHSEYERRHGPHPNNHVPGNPESHHHPNREHRQGRHPNQHANDSQSASPLAVNAPLCIARSSTHVSSERQTSALDGLGGMRKE